jgi:hypothetical protein
MFLLLLMQRTGTSASLLLSYLLSDNHVPGDAINYSLLNIM